MKLIPIANRNGDTGFSLPADGWVQLAGVGEYDHNSGIKQIIDQTAIESMCNRFKEESEKPNFPGLLLDWDHDSNDPKRPTSAAGWIEALENRNDGNTENPANGLWAKIRWSKSGKEAVEGGEYRLTSPVWLKSECEDLKENRFRPLRLDRAALTNDPQLRGCVPLSNRAEGTSDNANTVTREEMAAAIAEAVKNAGTSSGAHKGWETRRGALGSFHAKSAHASLGEAKVLHEAARSEGKKGNVKEAARLTSVAQSHEKMAANHEKLAASYKSKAAVSGAKAHINKQLEKMKSAKASPKAKLTLDPEKIKAAQKSHEDVKKLFNK